MKALLCSALFISVFFFGCGGDNVEKKENKPSYEILAAAGIPDQFGDTAVVKYRIGEMFVLTAGNHSYIRLNFSGDPNWYAKQILCIISFFEKEKPDLEITSWRLEKRHNAGALSERIYGIWIDHKPK